MEKQLIDVAATMPTVAPCSVVGAVAVQLNATMPGSMAYMKKSKSIACAVKRERAKVIFYFCQNVLAKNILRLTGSQKKKSDLTRTVSHSTSSQWLPWCHFIDTYRNVSLTLLIFLLAMMPLISVIG